MPLAASYEPAHDGLVARLTVVHAPPFCDHLIVVPPSFAYQKVPFAYLKNAIGVDDSAPGPDCNFVHVAAAGAYL